MQEEKELRLLIESLKSTLTDIPFYIDGDDDEDDWEDEEFEE